MTSQMNDVSFNKPDAANRAMTPLFQILHAWRQVADLGRSTMKCVVILLFALAILESRAVAGLDNDIPQTNRVVLSSGRWKPSAEETQKALAAIQTFLESPSTTNEWTKREIKKILEHTKEYNLVKGKK